ncbi:MAG: Ig-like domain-containing protein [Pirellulaceae bacterium]
MISVTEVNDAPSATNDSPTTNEDTPVTFNPLADDTDVDGTLDDSTVIFINPPAGDAFARRQDANRSRRRRLHRAANRRNHVQSRHKFSGTTTAVTYEVADNDGCDDFCEYYCFGERTE